MTDVPLIGRCRMRNVGTCGREVIMAEVRRNLSPSPRREIRDHGYLKSRQTSQDIEEEALLLVNRATELQGVLPRWIEIPRPQTCGSPPGV